MTSPLLNGLELSAEGLKRLRQQIENFDHNEVSDVVRDVIAAHWPHLLAKLDPPQKQ
jgi:hypothetical protein